MRCFLDLHLIDRFELRAILDDAAEIKALRADFSSGQADIQKTLKGKIVGLLFEKPSTRTRVSFEVGIHQLGGQALVLNGSEMHLGSGETASDTARVLSKYLDMIMIRTYNENTLVEFAKNSTIPVINGLTDRSHPCQIMADILTFEEMRGSIAGKTVVWIGPGNNVCNSYIHAAIKFKFKLIISCPNELRPDEEYINWAKSENAEVDFQIEPEKAVENADLIVTDTQVSMHEKNLETNDRLIMLKGYQVNQALMTKAPLGTLFLHCLPAYRNKEVTSEVLDGSNSGAFEAAENRLHVQKSIMKWCS